MIRLKKINIKLLTIWNIYIYTHTHTHTHIYMGFPGGSVSKESACDEADLGSIPGSGRSPGEGKGYPFQYPGLENSMDCIVCGSQRVRHDWMTITFTHTHTHTYIYIYIYSVCSLFAFFLFLQLLGFPSNWSHIYCPWFIFHFKDFLVLVTSIAPSKALAPSLIIFS